MPKFTVHWENYFKAANEKVNPRPEDGNYVLCGGYTAVTADSQERAANLWATAFPTDKILRIS